MAVNEASRLIPDRERSPVAPLREVPPEAPGSSSARLEVAPQLPEAAHAPVSPLREVPAEAPVPPAALEALERAAESIRPSWHEIEVSLPAPAPLPTWAEAAAVPPSASALASPPEQPSADATLRTSSLSPEDVAELLGHPPGSARWLRGRLLFSRTRPGARRLLLVSLCAGFSLLALYLLWPASDAQPDRAHALRGHAPPTQTTTPPTPLPTPAAAAAAPSLATQAPATADESAGLSGTAAAPEASAPTPTRAGKRRDKRAARSAQKIGAVKTRELKKPSKTSATAR